MIPVFMLVVFFQGAELKGSSMPFYDIDRCLYFAERLHKQPSIPQKEGVNLQITAYCKPIRKN